MINIKIQGKYRKLSHLLLLQSKLFVFLPLGWKSTEAHSRSRTAHTKATPLMEIHRYFFWLKFVSTKLSPFCCTYLSSKKITVHLFNDTECWSVCGSLHIAHPIFVVFTRVFRKLPSVYLHFYFFPLCSIPQWHNYQIIKSFAENCCWTLFQYYLLPCLQQYNYQLSYSLLFPYSYILLIILVLWKKVVTLKKKVNSPSRTPPNISSTTFFMQLQQSRP